MTWTPSGQVAKCIENSAHAQSMKVKTPAGATIGTVVGVLLHTQPDDPPLAYFARSATAPLAATFGYLLTATGYDDFVIEGVRSDGGYVTELRLRPHVDG